MRFVKYRNASFSYFPIFLISKFHIMKKTYITPLTQVTAAVVTEMLAASKLTPNTDSQDVTLTDEEYDGEFSVKEHTIDW